MVQLDAHQTDGTRRRSSPGKWSATTPFSADRLLLPTAFGCAGLVRDGGPEEVTRYLDAVTARVRDVFGDRVVGVYTTGSLALGDYRPDRSDIDLMAVVAGSAGLDLRRKLASQLDHRVLTCPAAGLEFVLYPLTTVAGQPWMPVICSTSTPDRRCRR